MARYVANAHLPGSPPLTPGMVFTADGRDQTLRGWARAGLITRTDDDKEPESAPAKARRGP